VTPTAGIEAEAEQPKPAAPGRPRNPEIDTAVLTAARELLVEVGYNRLSFELLARRAGVTRPTIYRRWPSKAHLVYDAVFPPEPIGMGVDSGDFERDLREFIGRAVETYRRPYTRAALPGLFADFFDSPALRDEVIHETWTSTRVSFRNRLALAHERGQVTSAHDSDRLLDVVTGTILQHVVVLQEEDPGFTDFLTALVLDPLRPARRERAR
jgi:AcrR family transcriptional regulator